MKVLTGILLLSSPAAAQSMGMPNGPCACGPSTATLLAAAVYAILAAIGYWVLQHADKETHNCVKRTGATVGAVLAIVGLIGLLCGVASHIKTAAAPQRSCGMGMHAGMMGDMLPPGPPHAGMMQMRQPPEKPQKADASKALK